jgi:hypothetical protein
MSASSSAPLRRLVIAAGISLSGRGAKWREGLFGAGDSSSPLASLGVALRASRFAPQICRTPAFSCSRVRISASITGAVGTSLSARGAMGERGIVRSWGQLLTPRFARGRTACVQICSANLSNPGFFMFEGSNPSRAAARLAEHAVEELEVKFGGERGIRTLEGLLALTPLAGVRLRPLGHLSGGRNHKDPERFLPKKRQAGRVSRGRLG